MASSGTAEELSNKLGITDGASGPAIVADISAYYGRASPNVWAWIKEKWESTGG